MLSRTTFILLTLSTCLLADTRESELKALFDSHKWFDLRDAVKRHGASSFYRCAVACAFGDVKQALKEADSVIKSSQDPSRLIKRMISWHICTFEPDGTGRGCSTSTKCWRSNQTMRATKPDERSSRLSAALLNSPSAVAGFQGCITK